MDPSVSNSGNWHSRVFANRRDDLLRRCLRSSLSAPVMSSKPPQILPYGQAPSPSGPKILLRTFLILLGLAIGIAATAGLGLFVWRVSDYDLNHSPHPPPIWP